MFEEKKMYQYHEKPPKLIEQMKKIVNEVSFQESLKKLGKVIPEFKKKEDK